MTALLGLALVTFIASAILSTQLARGLRSLPRLREEAPIAPDRAPSLSIVVAARDEAPHIARALRTLLSQDYPDFEVVAVDDRSTDGTGAILDRLAADHPDRLRVLHVTELPAGWLGKNHALQVGAGEARGDLLLFTDADILMRPDAVARAVGVLERRRLDHLAVAPRIRAGTFWATAVVAVFLVLFSTVFRPWKARTPGTRWHIGIGAFNLVRAPAYRAVGGHTSIALRPDDDVRLGRRLKAAGYRQDAAGGRDLVDVEWYPSVGAMARGLQKNAFAAVDYHLSLVAAGTLLPILLILWPLAALFVTSGATWWLNAGVVALALFTVGDTARGHGLPLRVAPVYPISGLLLLGIVWNAALRALATGSIEWRGTRYPLDRLRK